MAPAAVRPRPACCASRLARARPSSEPDAVVVEEQRAGLRKEPDDAEKKENIADARGDEGFFCGGRGGGLLIPEADEQIRGEADDLPAHEEQQQAVGDDDAEHGSGKEREEAEEAREVFVVGHVAHGVDEDEQADEADHHEHDGGERIEDPAEIDGGGAEVEPGEVDELADDSAVRPSWRRRGTKAMSESSSEMRERSDGERGGRLAARLLEQRDHARCDDGHGGDEPQDARDRGSGELWSECCGFLHQAFTPSSCSSCRDRWCWCGDGWR